MNSHYWSIGTAVEGYYGGVAGKVFPARCQRCQLATTFPVNSEHGIFAGVKALALPECTGNGHKTEAKSIPLVAVIRAKPVVNMPNNMPEKKKIVSKEGHMTGKGGGKDNHSRHRYYEEHKAEILADVEAMGYGKARQKHGIASSTMHYLLQRWNGQSPPRKVETKSTKVDPAIAAARAAGTTEAEYYRAAGIVMKVEARRALKGAPARRSGNDASRHRHAPSVFRERMAKLFRDLSEGQLPEVAAGLRLAARLIEVA